ncbi:SEC14 cytosolic factor family protein / phosphoglyceride transfer family protein [Melia azedarach]|uniref:SEC14 cytosolic factor family protein / phosphoglyceride transfer family protein n=2 Tax=Melia azedarach TaxID=155640 RepID=A0ACC1YQW8_MELAZ|nr:SEC14 cytosolic factor family protein / phosphoglyceride transfer family protein [Melia azedarach]KAJ4725847.1 SEC14 cytosolic factor family protein / phosphoglyceride transfer family protein [Melia azedarach]
MGDPSLVSTPSRNSEVPSVIAGKKGSKTNYVASAPKAFPRSNHRQVALLSCGKIGGGAAGHVAIFLLKVAALETVRRVSRAKCPFIWRGIQALQVICYPPFKLIQRWSPFKGLIRGMQMLSKPLLLISAAEAFSEQSECSDENSDGNSDSHAYPEIHSELSSVHSPPDTRVSDEASPSPVSENWLIQLNNELENQGISLPERINEDELRRFYTASNGNISSLLASVKKTIRWRETYRILSEEELEEWSDMVFWHGFDMQHRPCLIVRLGLACFVLPSRDRPRFAQAVISQVEHGVLHLVEAENPQITVLVDCEGLSPFRIPMQVMRSCSSLLQDHFPNRLGCLLVIHLPPVVRVITQTFIQILKPVTRKKVKIEGDMFHKVLSEYLLALPTFLGGNCTCTRCLKRNHRGILQPHAKDTSTIKPYADVSDEEDLHSLHLSHQADINMNGNCDQVVRAAVIGILMFWVFIALIAGFNDPESRPF